MSEPSARAEPLRLTSVPPHTGPSDGESSATNGGACWRKGSEVREYCRPLSDTATASASAPPPDARAAAAVAFAALVGRGGRDADEGVVVDDGGVDGGGVEATRDARPVVKGAPEADAAHDDARGAAERPRRGRERHHDGRAYAEKSFGLAA